MRGVLAILDPPQDGARAPTLGTLGADQNGSDSIMRAIFHQVAQLVGPPCGNGVSSCLQVQPGRNPLWSDVELKRTPGAAADWQTHIAGTFARRPKVTWENPGGSGTPRSRCR